MGGGGMKENNPPILREMIVLRQKIFFQSKTSGEYFTRADIERVAKENDKLARAIGVSEKTIKKTRGKNAYTLLQVDPINIPLGKTEKFDDWVNRKLTAKKKALDWLENKGLVERYGEEGWMPLHKPATTAVTKAESKGLAKSGKIVKRILRK